MNLLMHFSGREHHQIHQQTKKVKNKSVENQADQGRHVNHRPASQEKIGKNGSKRNHQTAAGLVDPGNKRSSRIGAKKTQ